MASDEPLRHDIQAAADRMENKVGAKREIRKLIEYLWEGERVEQMVAGFYGGGTGLVVLTDRRLFFVKDGWASKRTEDFPLEKISSVQWSSGPLTGKLTVFASGNKTEIANMAKASGKTMADTIRDRLSGRGVAPGTPIAPPPPTIHPPQAAAPPPPVAPPPPAPAAPTGSAEGVFEALEKLGKLRDAGIVTEAEFEAKKTELLARI